jgi:LytS/YehU family sensor histidine kinase
MYTSEIISAINTLILFICISWTLLYIVTKHRRMMDFMTTAVHSRKSIILMILIGGLVDVLASEFSFPLFGTSANVRDCIAIFCGIVGGPIVGIGVGFIGGLYRITGVWWSGFTGNLGYITALGCGISTMGAGLVGAWLYKRRNTNVMNLDWRKIAFVVLITAIWEIIHVVVINPPLMPFFSELSFREAFIFLGEKILPPMIVGNSFGMLVLLLVAMDTVKNKKVRELELESEKEREKLESLEKLVKKYEEYIGPVAKTIAKTTLEEKENKK